MIDSEKDLKNVYTPLAIYIFLQNLFNLQVKYCIIRLCKSGSASKYKKRRLHIKREADK